MKSEITLHTTIQRKINLVSSKIDNEIVMMSVENGEYYGLDEIGSRIWEIIEQPITTEYLILMLMEEFEVNREDCEKDTFEFLHDLRAKMLLETI